MNDIRLLVRQIIEEGLVEERNEALPLAKKYANKVIKMISDENHRYVREEDGFVVDDVEPRTVICQSVSSMAFYKISTKTVYIPLLSDTQFTSKYYEDTISDVIANDVNSGYTMSKKELYFSLVHEFTHNYDDIISDGKFSSAVHSEIMRSAGNKVPWGTSKYADAGYLKAYYNLPFEINAFVTQFLSKIPSPIKKLGFDGVLSAAKKERWFRNLDPDNRKRVIGRIYAEYGEHYE